MFRTFLRITFNVCETNVLTTSNEKILFDINGKHTNYNHITYRSCLYYINSTLIFKPKQFSLKYNVIFCLVYLGMPIRRVTADINSCALLKHNYFIIITPNVFITDYIKLYTG